MEDTSDAPSNLRTQPCHYYRELRFELMLLLVDAWSRATFVSSCQVWLKATGLWDVCFRDPQSVPQSPTLRNHGCMAATGHMSVAVACCILHRPMGAPQDCFDDSFVLCKDRTPALEKLRN